jgi:glycolate oxidase iron-sulfur subunit
MASSPHPAAPIVGFSGSAAPDRLLINTCIHCGLCLDECPTYRDLRVEMDSPRGRVQLIRAVGEGRLSLDDQSFRDHIYLCLDCRGCETSCPSGVKYGSLIETARIQATRIGNIPTGLKIANAVLRHVFLRPGYLRLLATLLRFYQRSGMRALLRRSGLLRLFPGDMEKAEAMTPRMSSNFLNPTDLPLVEAEGPRRFRVGFLTGCIMSVGFAEVHRASLRVLARAGCEVVLPPDQTCCGSLSLHTGDRRTAREAARRNIDAFHAADLDAIVVNSAGCGSTMKEWGELLADDERYAARAGELAAKVRDFSEWMAHIGASPGGRIAERVVVQDACHLNHAQGITRQPRDLVAAIPGVELVEMDNFGLCCGSAGIYSALNPDLAGRIRDEKLAAIAATGARTVITTNPGCHAHLRAGLEAARSDIQIVHLAEFLDRAQQSV